LVQLGLLEHTPILYQYNSPLKDYDLTAGVPVQWLEFAQKWRATSTLAEATKAKMYGILLRIGRWLRADLPDKVHPREWTRATAADFIAMVDKMLIGDHLSEIPPNMKGVGKPVKAGNKVAWIKACRTFFRDCYDWGWLPRRLNPAIALSVPRSIHALLGPDPRVISDDVWAKLVWAGLNLVPTDIPKRVTGATMYPFDMTRAIVLLWLFSGLRSDEIYRLTLGAVRWGIERTTINLITQTIEGESKPICFLDVPLNKTSVPFTKPVERIVGEAIEAWEEVRPAQNRLVDRKTGEYTDYLFQYRGRRLAKQHINHCVIPILCTKAGVPPVDARGRITSHRARATIASQLYNAKDPMTPYDVMTWLGHKSLQSTLHYLKITPNRLAKSYSDADYFRRNLRTINVLLDREAILKGAPARGEAWRYYDLGHGYCSNEFFSQCAHRMACARCSFYVPKQSQVAALIESRAANDRFVQEIPLTEEERAAVDGDAQAVDQLIAQLREVRAPDGSRRDA
jgi:integrase